MRFRSWHIVVLLLLAVVVAAALTELILDRQQIVARVRARAAVHAAARMQIGRVGGLQEILGGQRRWSRWQAGRDLAVVVGGRVRVRWRRLVDAIRRGRREGDRRFRRQGDGQLRLLVDRRLVLVQGWCGWLQRYVRSVR